MGLEGILSAMWKNVDFILQTRGGSLNKVGGGEGDIILFVF